VDEAQADIHPPVQETESAPTTASEVRAPRTSRERNRVRGRKRDETPTQSSGAAPASIALPRERPRADRVETDDAGLPDQRFKGMGDHVPAFLLRSFGSREDA